MNTSELIKILEMVESCDPLYDVSSDGPFRLLIGGRKGEYDGLPSVVWSHEFEAYYVDLLGGE